MNKNFLFALDLGKGPIMSKAICQKVGLVYKLSGCICVSGVATSCESILCKNLPTHKQLFSFLAGRIVLEPDQMSLPYQKVHIVHEEKINFN